MDNPIIALGVVLSLVLAAMIALAAGELISQALGPISVALMES